MGLQRVSQNYRTNTFTFCPVPRRQCTGVGFPGCPDSKESACSVGDLRSIPELRRSPGGVHGNPLQYSCLENPHGWKSLVGRVKTPLSDLAQHGHQGQKLCERWGHHPQGAHDLVGKKVTQINNVAGEGRGSLSVNLHS